jgi:general secretion pathway protein I
MRQRPQSGFTLIEVLVALVIVAVGMSALMGALSSSAKTVVYMQDKTFAEWVGLNQIANLRLQLTQGQVPPTGNTTGDIDFAGRSWHWRQEVIATQVQGIERIDVKVRPKDIKAGDDDSWYVTVSGLAGDSVGAPGTASAMISWDAGTGTTGATGTNGATQLNGTGTNGTGTGTTNSGGNVGTGLGTPTPTPAPPPTPTPNSGTPN